MKRTIILFAALLLVAAMCLASCGVNTPATPDQSGDGETVFSAPESDLTQPGTDPDETSPGTSDATGELPETDPDHTSPVSDPATDDPGEQTPEVTSEEETSPGEESGTASGEETSSGEPTDESTEPESESGEVIEEPIPETPAYVRVNANGEPDDYGGYLLYGSYPQSRVTDAATVSALNAMAGELPTASDSREWTSYGFYRNGSVQNYMWYLDLPMGGECYRGVYFIAYRPELLSADTTADNSRQDDNGYVRGEIYWFRFEPLLWRILAEEEIGFATVLCESIIDCRQFDVHTGSRTVEGGDTVYPNNYAESDIREWLNSVFAETAFTRSQQNLLSTVNVDNSARSTNPDSGNLWNNGENEFACADTRDRIFLLSERDVTCASYGFMENFGSYDPARMKRTTDYSRALGAWTSANEEYTGNGWWMLRSPYYIDGGFSYAVNSDGYASYGNLVRTTGGVVPALRLRIQPAEPSEPISRIHSLNQTVLETGKRRLDLVTAYVLPTGTNAVSKGFVLFRNDADYQANVYYDPSAADGQGETVENESYSQESDISVRSYSVNNPSMPYGMLTFGASSSKGFNGYSCVAFVVIEEPDGGYRFIYSEPQTIPVV